VEEEEGVRSRRQPPGPFTRWLWPQASSILIGHDKAEARQTREARDEIAERETSRLTRERDRGAREREEGS
jgi:hypothetical protein